MSQSNETQHRGQAASASPAVAKTNSPGSSEPGHPASAKSGRPQAVAGPFTLRDLVVGGSVLVMLIGSLIPYFMSDITYANMWNTLPLFFLAIGILLPVAVAGLFALRRLKPAGRIRIGSLSIDQFASVIAVLAVAFFFLQTASAFTAAFLIGLIGALGLLVATTFGRFIPFFAADFAGRQEMPAHVTAREAVVPEPKPAKPATSAKPAQQSDQNASQNSSRFTRPPSGAGSSTPVAGGAAAAAGGTAAATPAPAEAAGGADSPAQDIGAGAAENGRGYTQASDVHIEVNPEKDRQHNEKPVTAQPASDEPASDEPAMPAEPTASSKEPAASTAAQPGVSKQTAPATAVHPVVEEEPISATRSQDGESGPAIEAFWFAVGSPRPVIDEATGKEIFTFEPGDWELCLEDRGHEFVVQNKYTGQTGVMKDLSDIQIPPAEDSGSARN